MFNFGGPGWFNDVFELDLEFDEASRKIAQKGFLLEQTVCLFGAHEKITGKVRVKAPPNRTVSHHGISIELESSLQYYESLNSVQHTHPASTAQVDIAQPGSVTGEQEIRFEFDLNQIPEILDSYDGDKFDIRHSLLITVKRPWYTFNVTKNVPIAIQNLSAPVHTESEIKQQLAVVPRTSVIEVDDCGGKVTLDYQRSIWNLGECIEGQVVFSALEKPLPICKLILYKIEVADGENSEKTVKELDLVGNGQPGPIGVEGGSVQCNFNLNDAELTPTLVELNPAPKDPEGKPQDQDEDATVNVHYYLRLLVEDFDGKKSWNTHEVILLRNKISEGVLPTGVV